MKGIKDPEELRYEGVIGVVRESVKILATEFKLFLGLTLALIVPLCAVGLGHSLITEPMLARIRWDEYMLRRIQTSSGGDAHRQEEKIDEDIHQEVTNLYIAFAAYLFFLLAFSLLSTSAVVYSVASIYSEKSTSFEKLLFTVVPRVWKRLFLTFLWAILLIFTYSAVFLVAFLFLSFVWFSIFTDSSDVAIAALNWFVLVSFLAGLIYVECVWHLGSVIAVLEEEAYGMEAMKRSARLIQGRRAMAYILFCVYFGVTFLLGAVFSLFVVHGLMLGLGAGWRMAIAIAVIAAVAAVDLLGFIVQTVFYFACKAYHHEAIDKSQLSEHLGAYLGEYVPLRGSIQLETMEP